MDRFLKVELASRLFWDWLFLSLSELGGTGRYQGVISNGGYFQSLGNSSHWLEEGVLDPIRFEPE